MLQALEVKQNGAEGPQPVTAPEISAGEAELAPVAARVKWFDATRGFGFLVSDAIDGDILVHFSVLREHGRRSLPEGALVECIPTRLERGLQANSNPVDRCELGDAAAAAAPPAKRSESRPPRAGQRRRRL